VVFLVSSRLPSGNKNHIHGAAWLGKARQGRAGHGTARLGMAGQGTAGQG
jgi:hypothetical protein